MELEIKIQAAAKGIPSPQQFSGEWWENRLVELSKLKYISYCWNPCAHNGF